MSRMQTIIAGPGFNRPPTGAMNPEDILPAFQALLHNRRRVATELREIEARLDVFVEERVTQDRRLATRLKGELDRERSTA